MFLNVHAVIYMFGAVITLWFGGEPIGTLQPVTLRPIFVILGAILMLGMFILMLTTRDFTRQLDRGEHAKKVVAPLFAKEECFKEVQLYRR